MKLLKVEDRKTERKFLEVARCIYKDDPNWVCPPDNMIRSVFDPLKNDWFENGDAVRWILISEKGELIGRVAAFYNLEKAANYKIPVGGIGFFECIDNRDAAFFLFNVCQEWLEKKGMQAMDGPVNPGENVNFWGLLVEGFTPPAIGMNYNPPYYREFFKSYGFKPFFEQVTKHLDVSRPFPERFWKIAGWVLKKPGFTFKHYKKSEIDRLAKDLVDIHNQAWIYHEHYTPLTV
ncbi:MAG: hypothetical protein K8R53_03740, partial [Bacteroidales bacterium]|nr:hypothetical protein [Bacteroidales bacterium]